MCALHEPTFGVNGTSPCTTNGFHTCTWYRHYLHIPCVYACRLSWLVTPCQRLQGNTALSISVRPCAALLNTPNAMLCPLCSCIPTPYCLDFLSVLHPLFKRPVCSELPYSWALWPAALDSNTPPKASILLVAILWFVSNPPATCHATPCRAVPTLELECQPGNSGCACHSRCGPAWVCA